MRKSAALFLPKHTATAGWFHLEHTKDFRQCPGQGNVDGPLECSLALGMFAVETRGRAAAQQASGSLPWIGVDDPSVQRLQAEHTANFQMVTNFQLGGPEKVARSWSRLTCTNSTTPMRKLERNEPHRKRRSFTS